MPQLFEGDLCASSEMHLWLNKVHLEYFLVFFTGIHYRINVQPFSHFAIKNWTLFILRNIRWVNAILMCVGDWQLFCSPKNDSTAESGCPEMITDVESPHTPFKGNIKFVNGFAFGSEFYEAAKFFGRVNENFNERFVLFVNFNFLSAYYLSHWVGLRLDKDKPERG